ncbi:MAG: thiamine-monophosphate kinase [Planctomycetaceae bacterium]|nr:thiamine-monophosphate kinase [Planctomycetaceae bacterium]
MESEYIAWLQSEVQRRQSIPGARFVPLGIGDDAAIVESATETVCCADLLAEGTHFISREPADWEQVGRKALAVNLSDMAAMGAKPETALLSLLVNRDQGLQQAQAVTRGLLKLADEFGVVLVGGDTCSWNGGLVVNVTVLGRLLNGRPLQRRGAQAGDAILVTGSLGGSILKHHWAFTPRCREIDLIYPSFVVHAATDISDGLVRDLSHVAEASAVGARLFAEQIPISAAAEELARIGTPSATHLPLINHWPVESMSLQHALYDGEDFELLIVMPPNEADRLLAAVSSGQLNIGCHLTKIGEATRELGLQIVTPSGLQPLPIGGYQH